MADERPDARTVTREHVARVALEIAAESDGQMRELFPRSPDAAEWLAVRQILEREALRKSADTSAARSSGREHRRLLVELAANVLAQIVHLDVTGRR